MKSRFFDPFLWACFAQVLIVAALLPPSASATPGSKPAGAGCIAVPGSFSAPPVKAKAAPANLWKGWHYDNNVTLAATPASALVDQPATIRVTGLKPGQPVTLRASLSNYRRRRFVAQATFTANDEGVVNVARQAPEYGSYSGVHAMGLIWSMEPQGAENPSSAYFVPSGDRYTVHLEAEAAGRVLAQGALIRHYRASGVTKTVVKSHGLVGDFFLPATPGPHPAVLVLGGSEGGLHPQVNEAALLASHGYAALGLAYFQGFEGRSDPRLAHLPKMLVNIPLEYFVKAADWMKRQPGVDARRVAIMGWSKGAEAALVTAAMFPNEFQAAIGWMPSSVVWEGIQYGPGPVSSSWTLKGKPLPWLGFDVNPKMFTSGKPISFTAVYAASLASKNRAAVAAAAIPVERIRGPLLLVSAGDDRVWPSAVMARQIMQRLAVHRHPYRDESLCYAGAGHIILPPYRPTNASAFGYPGGSFAFGGNPIAYAFADADAWHKLLAFLHTALR